MTYPDEPMFYTVFCFEPAADGFIITGIYSLERDAEAHAADRNAQPRHHNSAHIERLTLDQVITRLVKDRLRELADALDRLAAADASDRANP